MIDFSRIGILKLAEDTIHLTGGFDCGDKDLNEFLKNDSINYLHGKIAVTYLIVLGEKVVGFFCLSNDSVELKGKDKKKLDDLGKRKRTYPSLKIARLAVSRDDWNKGIGSFIVKHTIGTGLLQSETVGCRYLTVDAYNKDVPVNFYLSKGFKKLVKETDKDSIPMYLDLQEYAKD